MREDEGEETDSESTQSTPRTQRRKSRFLATLGMTNQVAAVDSEQRKRRHDESSPYKRGTDGEAEERKWRAVVFGTTTVAKKSTIIRGNYGPCCWVKTWTLRDNGAAGSGRHGRGVSSARHAARAYCGD